MRGKLSVQMQQALERPIEDLKVCLGNLQKSDARLSWSPESTLQSNIYPGQRVSRFISLKNINLSNPGEIKIFGKFNGQDTEIAQIDRVTATKGNLVIQALRQQVEKIEELIEEKRSDVKNAITLSQAANIVSKYTSLVAVDLTSEGRAEEIIPIEIIPAPIPHQTMRMFSRPGNMRIPFAMKTMAAAPSSMQVLSRGRMLGAPTIQSGDLPSPEAEPMAQDQLDMLINLQNNDGSFRAGDEWIKLFQRALDDINLATAVALKFMETNLKDQEVEWKLIHRKAYAWLKNQAVDVENLFLEAYNIIRGV